MEGGGGPWDYVFLLSEGELCNVGESRFEPDNLWRTQIGLVPFTLKKFKSKLILYFF